MNLKSYLITGLLVVTTATAWAQKPQRRGGPDVMAENLFPPELVMQNQKTLALTDDQTKAIQEEMQKMMAKFTDLQWQQSAEGEALTALLKQDKPDEKQILAQFDKLLGIENEVKKLHFGSMVRIKNLLTSEQQAQLRQIKKQARPPMPPRERTNQPRPQPPEE